MTAQGLQLPVAVTDHPHWRVNIRPPEYISNAIPTLRRCVELIEHNAVSFRGWDYPHWGIHHNDVAYGNTWIASWADFMGTKEYWRLYQSAQFIHLFAVREATEPEWDQKLRRDTQSHLSHIPDLHIDSVPGFISLVNLFYTVAEITEFITRMAASEVYAGPISLSISLTGIQGFLLTTDWNRSWHDRYAAGQDTIANDWVVQSDELLADPVGPTVDIIKWIVARFGWLDPSTEVIEKDVRRFRKGVV